MAKQQKKVENQMDGSGREAMAALEHEQRLHSQRLAEYAAYTVEEAEEKGYLGYSPTGPGERDGAYNRSAESRLGSLGEFGDGERA